MNKELWEIVGNVKANGQCSKGDNCSFRHDMNKRAKLTQPNPSPSSFMQQNERSASRTEVPEARVPVVECLDGLARITSMELAPIHSVKMASSRMLVLQVRECLQIWEKCSYAHRQVDEQPSKRSKKNGDKSAVAILNNTRQLVCVFQDMVPSKSLSI